MRGRKVKGYAWGDRRGVRLRLEPQNMRGFPPRVQGFCCCSRSAAANEESEKPTLVWRASAPMWKAPSPGFLHQPTALDVYQPRQLRRGGGPTGRPVEWSTFPQPTILGSFPPRSCLLYT